jgi:hypothetical protein
MIELTIESLDDLCWQILPEEEPPLKPLKITFWRGTCQWLEAGFAREISQIETILEAEDDA